MDIFFTKMQGAGNDFILLDNRKNSIQLNTARISYLCDRYRGIGADGLLVIENGDATEPRMVYFNADGSRASFCGNGARCFARFLFEKGVGNIEKKQVSFITDAGRVTGWISEEGVKITVPSPKDLRLQIPLRLNDRLFEVHKINTGVPHVVLFGDYENLSLDSFRALGSSIRWHEDFKPEGTNVNFVWKVAEQKIKIRTYERGVEGETLACGSGVTASALISHLVLGMDSPIEVLVRSGDSLKVYFTRLDQAFNEVILEGPAKKVFVGTIDIA
ncbi:diaminopimelate epimerase [Methylacidiphilum caldifontis]|uniref:diaminopimelate epimerase n=1 Tax=Methylacidiphilum caldifontis TaxID=2795386 RepID=UPI001A8F26ED|nr:diaminopimelate epimerase [Methylacidiphilum caldifontis]QSR89523.1 diaminopimelate epimerase [Methylacidiphilum caldifontis]